MPSFADALDAICDAGGGFQSWEAALAVVADSLGATDAAIYSAPPDTPYLTSVRQARFSAINETYLNEFAASDLQIRRFIERGEEGYITGDALLSAEEADACIVHREFLEPNKIDAQAVYLLKDSEGGSHTFVLMRGKQDGSFNDAILRTMQSFAPHVRRSIEVSNRISHLENQGQALESALAQVLPNTLIVDGKGNILWRAGGETPVSNPELCVGISLRARLAENDRKRFSAMLSHAREGRGSDFLCTLAGQSEPILVSTAPLPAGMDFLASHNSQAVLVLLTEIPRTNTASVSQRQVGAAFSLTAAEAELALHLAKGGDLDTFAACRGVSIHTARNQLKACFQKLDVTRQSELVGRVHSLHAARGTPTAFFPCRPPADVPRPGAGRTRCTGRQG